MWKAEKDLIEIRGIPTAVTDEHNEVFPHWWDSGLKDSTLLHVDAHPDMDDGGKVSVKPKYSLLDIAQFICPAVYHEIVSSIYWLNPHSSDRRLQDMGTARNEGRRKLAAKTKNYLYLWHGGLNDKIYDAIHGYGKIIKNNQISMPPEYPFILDIDLDAFCCHRGVYFSHPDIENYERKINETMFLLKDLREPDLITITGSQAKTERDTYVPPKIVGTVYRCLTERLEEIY